MHDDDPPETVRIEITDTLDLHSFRPQEVAEVVESFLEAAVESGFAHLRIIHGKGIGVQRRTVRSLLARHPDVQSFADAPGGAGSWGATTVILKPKTVPDP
jgi:DNA-nicking Smr family endonuclease